MSLTVFYTSDSLKRASLTALGRDHEEFETGVYFIADIHRPKVDFIVNHGSHGFTEYSSTTINEPKHNTGKRVYRISDQCTIITRRFETEFSSWRPWFIPGERGTNRGEEDDKWDTHHLREQTTGD